MSRQKAPWPQKQGDHTKQLVLPGFPSAIQGQPLELVVSLCFATGCVSRPGGGVPEAPVPRGHPGRLARLRRRPVGLHHPQRDRHGGARDRSNFRREFPCAKGVLASPKLPKCPILVIGQPAKGPITPVCWQDPCTALPYWVFGLRPVKCGELPGGSNMFVCQEASDYSKRQPQTARSGMSVFFCLAFKPSKRGSWFSKVRTLGSI